MSFAAGSRRSRRCSNARNERGWALISVLWTVTALALMAAAAQELTVTSYRSERHAMVDARASADLDAAVARAVLGISDRRPERRWRVDGATTTFLHDGLAIAVTVQDETGRIDLNTSSGAIIRQLLMSKGLAPDDAGKLADSIIAWRSAAGLDTARGATDADYGAAHLSYLPRHGPFETVAELKLVLGMTESLYARLAPALTVYSKRPNFDASVAPREVLAVLYPNDPQKIDAILRARDGDPAAALRFGFSPGAAATLIAPSGRAFQIVARLAIGRRSFRRDAVVALTGDDKRPFFALAWR